MTNIYISQSKCRACNGRGVQYSHKKGLRVICPACNGTGKINRGLK